MEVVVPMPDVSIQLEVIDAYAIMVFLVTDKIAQILMSALMIQHYVNMVNVVQFIICYAF